MKKVLLSLLASAVVATSLNAQDEETTSSPLVLSGSVDTYYRTTLNTADQGGNAGFASSFGNGVGFNIGMINLVASKEGEKAGFVADVVFGPRGDEATFADANGLGGTANLVNQLYAYYNLTDELTFTLGNFNTFLGYEVISPAANFNYSTSHLFSYGPFSHTGAKLDYAINDEFSVMVAALNPTDIKTLSPSADSDGNNIFFGAQLGYANESFSAYLNYLGGNNGPDGSDTTSLNQIDLTLGYQVTDEFYLGLNTSLLSASTNDDDDDNTPSSTGFFGIAGYAQYAISDAFAIGGRAEFFSDKNNFTDNSVPFVFDGDDDFNTTGNVTSLTLSAQYSVGDLTFIPEIRADFYGGLTDGDPSATDGGNVFDTKADDNITSIGAVSLAAVYAF